jgi:hypothetical protein
VHGDVAESDAARHSAVCFGRVWRR